MARAKDKQKLERLKDEIEALKHRGIDHQHPKFQEWKKEATSTLKAMYGNGSPLLMKLEEIGSRRREDRMWEEEHDIRGRGKAAFKQDLERAREILDEALEVSHLLGEDGAGIGEEEFISTVSKKEAIPADRETPSETPVETPPETPVVETPPETLKEAPSEKPVATLPEAPPVNPPEAPPAAVPEIPPQVLPEPQLQAPIAEGAERRREEDIAELLHELEKDKKDLEKVQATLEEALEGISAPSEEDRLEELIEQLEEQIKDPNVQMRKVQKTMEELLRVKGKKALLQRLTQETRDPKVPWGKIRDCRRGGGQYVGYRVGDHRRHE
ncbi:MAG: hypothetical protein P8Y09_00430 [Deltaproteobacteria bacterium]